MRLTDMAPMQAVGFVRALSRLRQIYIPPSVQRVPELRDRADNVLFRPGIPAALLYPPRPVFFMRALNSEHQRSALMEMAGLLNENKGVIKLVIIDSIMALYRVDYQGRGELQKRQSELGQFLHQLKQLCEEVGLCFESSVARLGHAT